MNLTPYERASDAFSRHTDQCPQCQVYGGPPVFHCKAARRLLDKLAEAGKWEAGR